MVSLDFVVEQKFIQALFKYLIANLFLCLPPDMMGQLLNMVRVICSYIDDSFNEIATDALPGTCKLLFEIPFPMVLIDLLQKDEIPKTIKRLGLGSKQFRNYMSL